MVKNESTNKEISWYGAMILSSCVVGSSKGLTWIVESQTKDTVETAREIKRERVAVPR